MQTSSTKPPLLTHPNYNIDESLVRLQFGDGHRRWIKLGHLIRLEAESNYTRCIFRDGSQLLVSITLGNLLKRIKAPEFVRIHSKHAVNRQYVTGVNRMFHVVRLTTGETVDISRRRLRDTVTSLSN